MLAKIFTTVKYTLVAVNFLFLITGIIILSVGSSVQSAYNGYHEFLSERFFSLPAFCIATGVIIFLISFAGFYGAFMENYYIIMAFVLSMLLMFIFQLSACIGGYVLRGNTVALVQKQLLSTMQLYDSKKNLPVTVLWDEVQRDFSCCGVIDPSDWLTPLQTNDSRGVPVSCCQHVWGTINTFTCNTTSSFQQGCAEAFGNWVQKHVGAIGISGIVLVLMQFSCCGVIDPSDWLTPLQTNDSRGVPVSCCQHVWGTINTFTCNTTSAFQQGCAEAFGNWVQKHVGAIGISGIVLVLMQALAVAGAVWLANITRQEREFP